MRLWPMNKGVPTFKCAAAEENGGRTDGGDSGQLCGGFGQIGRLIINDGENRFVSIF